MKQIMKTTKFVDYIDVKVKKLHWQVPIQKYFTRVGLLAGGSVALKQIGFRNYNNWWP